MPERDETADELLLLPLRPGHDDPHETNASSSRATRLGIAARAPLDPGAVLVGDERGQRGAVVDRRPPARGSRRRRARRTRRSASTRRRVSASSAAATSASSPARTWSASEPWPASGQQLGRLEAMADLGARGRGGRGRTPPARPRRDRARRACAGACRCCRAAARSRASARARAAARAGGPTPSRSASPAAARSRRRARRADPRAAGRRRRRARPDRVEVMSFAEWTATSIRPSSSASSSSLTKTPREPISPKGFVRSRSPAVVIGTSAISIASPRPARSLSAACSAWVRASLLPREPTRMSTASPRCGPRLAASTRPGRTDRPDPHERGRHLQRERPAGQKSRVHRRRSSSSSPNRCLTTSA